MEFDSEALKGNRASSSICADLEAGLVGALWPPGMSRADQMLDTTQLNDEEENLLEHVVELENRYNLSSWIQNMLNYAWSSRELIPSRMKLVAIRLLFLAFCTTSVLVVLCGTVILSYMIVMLVLLPRAVVVNYLVDPYMEDSPSWGPSVIACVSASILGVLFIVDDWTERTYRKEWFGLCEWSSSPLCLAAQIVLLYMFFETVYISLGTFILSFLSFSPRFGSVGYMFITAGPANVFSFLLASTILYVIFSVLVHFLEQEIENFHNTVNNHAIRLHSMTGNILLFLDTVFRVIGFLSLGVALLCCLHLLVTGIFLLCSFVIRLLIDMLSLHDTSSVLPFPTVD